MRRSIIALWTLAALLGLRAVTRPKWAGLKPASLKPPRPKPWDLS
jgi:hypothetical protein